MNLIPKEDKIYISFPYDPEVIQKIKEIPGRIWDPVNKVWIIPVQNYPYFSTIFGENDKCKIYYEEYIRKESSELNNKILELESKLESFKLLSQPFKYQIEGSAFLLKNKQVVLNFDLGTGKTICALVASLALVKEDGKSKILVITPSSLKQSWINEMEKFFGKEFLSLVSVVKGERKDREKIYFEFLHRDYKNYLIMNYELVRNSMDFEFLKDVDWKCVVLDEVSRIKNFRTQTFKYMIFLRAQYMWGLTGYVLENSL